MSKGYIYIASNNVGGVKKIDYVKEAIFSATSLRKINPNANITLYTDLPIKNNIFSEIKIVKMELRCKQNILNNAPYDKNIYIDTDTYINHTIEDMFEMLDRYELLCISDYARKRNLPIPEYMNIPNAFSELNGGIIGFKKSENFFKMIDLWNEYFQKYKSIMPWDQPSFRVAVWESKINLYILPMEYNRRGKNTKEKCIKNRIDGDKRFPKDHLKTRIFHFHGLENMNEKEMEDNAQYF